MSEQTKPGPGLTTSDALFEAWFQAQRARTWNSTEPIPDGWSSGFRHSYKLGWDAAYAAAAGPPMERGVMYSVDRCRKHKGWAWSANFTAALGGVVDDIVCPICHPPDAAPPAASAEGEPVTVWRHYKGGMYERIRGVLRESDAQTLVLYRSCETGAHWVRPIREFEEKFTRVDAVPLRKRPASAAPKAEPHADEDGACTRCGLRFQEEDCTDPHECPPGFNPPTPDDGRSDAELLQRLDEWPKSLAVPPTGLTMTLRTPSVQHEAAARLRELLAEREHTGERIERAVTAALSGDYIGVVTALSGTDALLAPAKTGGGNG